MKERTLEDLREHYDVDLDEIVERISKESANLVLLQFPDGLKIYATAIVDYLESKTSAEFLIYLGACYGACDTPVGFEDLGVDLVFQIGHNELMPNY